MFIFFVQKLLNKFNSSWSKYFHNNKVLTNADPFLTSTFQYLIWENIRWYQPKFSCNKIELLGSYFLRDHWKIQTIKLILFLGHFPLNYTGLTLSTSLWYQKKNIAQTNKLEPSECECKFVSNVYGDIRMVSFFCWNAFEVQPILICDLYAVCASKWAKKPIKKREWMWHLRFNSVWWGGWKSL